jgi:cytochrome oxidase Cu insertion factor (SCO1/SenC/PrrC family)
MPKRLVPGLLFVLLSFSPLHAQLGPKDGANLPATDLKRVKIGDPAPEFALEDTDGKKIALSDFRDKKNVVLVFYRGHW